MNQKRIILIKTNPLDVDPRLVKEIDALKHGGYSITLLCWDRDCQDNKTEKPKDFNEIRLKLKAPWGIKILPFLPIWWCITFFYLMKTNWDILHAINFDTVVPAMLVAKIKRKPIIYEMYDTYEDMINLPRIIRNACVSIDKLFMRLATAVIIVDEARIEELCGIPNPNIAVIYNSPLPSFVQPNDCRSRNSKFNIFFAATLHKSRRLNLDKVIAAIKNINNVELIIAGYGDQVEEIKKWTKNMPDKVKFIGKISYAEVISRNMKADLLFTLYDPIIPINKYASPNKLFEAMMCGKPILVSEGTATARIVKEENCGLVVDCNNTDEIKNKIITLKKNPELCKRLGDNGKKAYEQKYSWALMEQRLLSLYQQIDDTSKKKVKGVQM